MNTHHLCKRADGRSVGGWNGPSRIELIVQALVLERVLTYQAGAIPKLHRVFAQSVLGWICAPEGRAPLALGSNFWS